MSEPIVSIVVAMAENRVIGRDGGLPWRLSSDLKRFKAITMGKPIIMGRKTWESLGRPLPGRPHIVVTRNEAFDVPGVDRAGTLDEAIGRGAALAEAAGVGEVCIVGGGELYAQTLDRADRLHVTHVEAEVEGDTVFPAIDPATWVCVREERLPAGEKDSHATRYAVYHRRAATKFTNSP